MAIMPHEKFHFNRLMLTLIFGIQARRTTYKAGPDKGEDTSHSANFRACMHAIKDTDDDLPAKGGPQYPSW